MPIDPLWLLYGVLFAAILFLVEGLYYLVREARDGTARAVNRRLRLAVGESDPRQVLTLLRRESQTGFSRTVAELFPSLDRLMLQAGLSFSLGRLVALVLLAGVVVGLVLALMSAMALWHVIVLVGFLMLLMPFLVLRYLRARRIKRFGAQLPEALDLIVRSLRAGHPVASAMSLVAKEMKDPVGTEFGIAVDEMTYGLDITESLANMTQRIPQLDLQFLTVTIQIQHSTGGNLAEILGNLSAVIRSRFAMYAKVKALSSEGRMSAVVVGLLPFVVSAIIVGANPSFFGDVRGDPLFIPMIAFAGVLLALGQFTIWRMVNMKV